MGSDEVGETVEAARRRAGEARERYRASGFKLMATIISLSAGGMVAFSRQGGGGSNATRALFFVMCLALLQQVLSYIGEVNSFELSDIWADMKNHAAKEEMNEFWKLDEKFTEFYAKERSWFHWADVACYVTTIAFVVVGSCLLI